MVAAAQRVASFEELYRAIEALAPGLTGEILEAGVIRTMGRPAGPHRITARSIARALEDDDTWEGGRGGWLEQEAEVRLPGDRLAVPDLSGWRLADGEPVPPAFVFQNPIVRVPDWCCEILSPSTERVDRDLKVPLYAQAGVTWIWLVDPETRRVEVLQTQAHIVAVVEVVEGDVSRPIPPFASKLDTSRWWVNRPTGP